MLTPDGSDLFLSVLHEQLPPVVVRVYSEEGAFEDAPPNQGSPTITPEGLLYEATFGQDQANFHWVRRAIVVDDKVIDSTDEDMGVKVTGSAWTVKSFISLVPDSSGD